MEKVEILVQTSEEGIVSSTENLVGRRIEYQGDHGTVKYHGPLKHHDEKQDPKQIWLGVQWDDPTRGRHNGTVKGVQYFVTDDGQNSGTLLKMEKANFGITIYDGILQRYFLKPNQTTETENKEKQVNEKGITVEYDEDAFFETVRKFKKKVEFLGFDKIWKKINDLKHLEELSLPDCKISDIGPDGSLQQLLPSVTNLSLESNLLYDWNQVFLIGRELKNLEQLSISHSILPVPEEDVRNIDRIIINSNDTFIKEPPLNVFANLKTIILISMNLTWKALNKLLPMFLNVEELVLCFNKLTDFENLQYEGKDFKNLQFLNLEGNGIESFQGVMKFSSAPLLDKLILNKNKLKELGKVHGFENLKWVVLEENDILEFYIFSQLNMFPKLEIIRVTKNPIYSKHSVLHIRQRAIAEIKGLKNINGSELKKYERKDCEIYYLRNTFQEFFEKSGQKSVEYDYNQFLDYCASEHPRIPELIKIFGNPYDEGIKGNEIKFAEPTIKAPGSNFIRLSLNAFTGSAMGKPAVKKKFPLNTLITNLKAMLAKLFGIPANKQKVYYKADQNDPFSPLDEDLKDLSYYGLQEGSEIWVGDEEL